MNDAAKADVLFCFSSWFSFCRLTRYAVFVLVLDLTPELELAREASAASIAPDSCTIGTFWCNLQAK